MLEDYKRVGIVRRERWQSKERIEFIHEHEVCCVPGCNQHATVHHLVRGRTNISSDLLTVPLCQEHHMELDGSLKDELFEERHNVNLLYECVCSLERQFESLGQATPYKTEHKKVNRGTAKPRKSKRKNRTPYNPYKRPW